MSTLHWIIIIVAWFAPVFICGWMARHWLRKDGDKVIFVGLIFGLIGAAIAAVALPKLTDEEWEAAGKKPERAAKSETDVLIIVVVVLCVIAVAGVAALMMI